MWTGSSRSFPSGSLHSHIEGWAGRQRRNGRNTRIGRELMSLFDHIEIIEWVGDLFCPLESIAGGAPKHRLCFSIPS